MSEEINKAQEAFDAKYITSGEIERRMRVNRTSILSARKRGLLPNPIQLCGNRAFIWERERVEPYLKVWEVSLASRRKELMGNKDPLA